MGDQKTRAARRGERGRAALPMRPRPALGSCSALSGRRERTDRNVTSVRISERELLGLSVRIHVWLLFEPSDALNRQVTYSDFFFSRRRRNTRLQGDWSSDVCSS